MKSNGKSRMTPEEPEHEPFDIPSLVEEFEARLYRLELPEEEDIEDDFMALIDEFRSRLARLSRPALPVDGIYEEDFPAQVNDLITWLEFLELCQDDRWRKDEIEEYRAARALVMGQSDRQHNDETEEWRALRALVARLALPVEELYGEDFLKQIEDDRHRKYEIDELKAELDQTARDRERLQKQQDDLETGVKTLLLFGAITLIFVFIRKMTEGLGCISALAPLGFLVALVWVAHK
jgi:hypothetical protein